jgi:hypothetical protein
VGEAQRGSWTPCGLAAATQPVDVSRSQLYDTQVVVVSYGTSCRGGVNAPGRLSFRRSSSCRGGGMLDRLVALQRSCRSRAALGTARRDARPSNTRPPLPLVAWTLQRGDDVGMDACVAVGSASGGGGGKHERCPATAPRNAERERSGSNRGAQQAGGGERGGHDACQAACEL